MAGVRERADANRTREAGHLDEIQGVVANMLKLHHNGAVGFIAWLGLRLWACLAMVTYRRPFNDGDISSVFSYLI